MQAPEPSSDRRKQDLLRQALQRKTPLERAAFLDGACSGEAALRAEMEALLTSKTENQATAPHNADTARVHVEAGTPQLAPTLFDETPITEGAGTVIGRYKLLEQIGEGGFGVVYVAEQREPVKRQVALKIIKLGMDTRQVVARFEAERQALALMDHPNIAKVFDAGATDTGRPFFVMELVKGVPITQYCDQEKLKTSQRLGLFVRVCQAVQHAHQKGIIHRDIKPSNILVTLQEGTPVPKVIDFGIAKATQQKLTEKTLHTQLQQFIGTPAYMSPEQAEMSGLDIDTRSDIYSLGVLLYELLTSTTPFDTQELLASGLDAMRKTIREKEPPRPSTRLTQTRAAQYPSSGKSALRTPPSAIDSDLDWIVMKCLEKDRTRRYDTANGLSMDVQRHLGHEPVIARPPSNLYRFQKLVRRNKLVFAAATAVGGMLVLGVAMSTWQALRATRAEQQQSHLREEADKARLDESVQRREADEARKKEAQLRLHAETQELAARQKAYASDMNLIQQSLAVNNLGRAQELLNRQRPQPDQKDLRGWEWRYLWQQCQSDALYELCCRSNAIWSLAVSADRKWLVIGEQHQGQLSIWDLTQRKQLAAISSGDVKVAFSPSRSLLAFTYSEELASASPRYGVRFWDGEDRQFMTNELPLKGECVGLAFSEDGQRLITPSSSPANELVIWRLEDGTRMKSYPVRSIKGGIGNKFAATPDLRFAAWVEAGDGNDLIHLIDLTTGKERWCTNTAGNTFTTALAFSPDARLLASGDAFLPSPIHLYDVVTGQEIQRLAGHEGWIGSLVFLAGGKTLASASSDQTIRLWDVSDLTNVPRPRILHGHRLEVWQLAPLTGSEKFASGSKDGSVCIWETATPRKEPARITVATSIYNWRFTAGGGSVLTFDYEGHVVQWRGQDFRQSQSLLDFRAETLLNLWPNRNHSFSGDGRLLAVGLTNGTVQVWNLRERALLREFTGLGDPWTRDFLDQGRSLVVVNAGDRSHHELDLATGKESRSWGANEFHSLEEYFTTVSPDEHWCLTVGVRSLLKDLTTDQEIPVRLSLVEANGVAFSSDGRLFAALNESGFAEVWDVARLQRVSRLTGFLQGVHSIAWSPDGTRLAIGSDGREAIKLWDVGSSEELLTLEAEGAVGAMCQFSGDGNILGAVDSEGRLILWRAPSWTEIEAAEKNKEDKKQ